jgi:precorrin-6A/cobalt-precorrin-6A reductase
MKILILGGTAEARALANRLVDAGHVVITSLAGRTQDPKLPQGDLRMGGFGGVTGLAAYLQEEAIERFVDATHPYAAKISNNAVAAAEAVGVPLVRYMRPAWEQKGGDDWTIVGRTAEAAAALPSRAKVLLTSGHTGLEHFMAREDCRFIVRTIEAPAMKLPPHAKLMQDRPPYSHESELALMQDNGITHLVTKNSGGSQTQAKLEAARQLGVRVIMLARPVYGRATEVASIDDTVAALALD